MLSYMVGIVFLHLEPNEGKHLFKLLVMKGNVFQVEMHTVVKLIEIVCL